jgi:peptide/nickel transport system ATP-binding protein
MSAVPPVVVESLDHHYGKGALRRQILFDVSATIPAGEIIIVTGPSGSGKTTLLTLIGALRAAQAGSVRILGEELCGANKATLEKVRRRIGFIFQQHNLLAALTATENVELGLRASGRHPRDEVRRRAREMLEAVGLEAHLDKRAHQMSGGQRQRVVIAIALACGPDLLIADEPTTALDVTIQREVLDLIAELVAEDGMGLLLISHDLGVMAETVQRMLVMYGGTVVESGPTAEVFGHLSHPYTRGLFAARPRLGVARGTRLATIPGRVPELADLPAGCPFAERCAFVVDDCRRALPPPVAVGPQHLARCIRLEAVAKAAHG